jgi:hypothetical protein
MDLAQQQNEYAQWLHFQHIILNFIMGQFVFANFIAGVKSSFAELQE